MSRRHASWAITFGEDRGIFVKQGDCSVGFGTVCQEAKSLQHLQSASVPASVKERTPSLIGYFEPEDLLVTSLIKDAQTLRALTIRRRPFAHTIAGELGTLLGNLHQSPPPLADGLITAHPPPWILSLHRPRLSLLRETSAGNHQLIKILQRAPGVCQNLETLKMDWRQSNIIHFDLKFDNILICPPSSGRQRKTRLTLVDWEFSGYGEAAWDVGSFFAEILYSWVRGLQPELSSVVNARINADAAAIVPYRPALNAFWRNYCHVLQFDNADRREYLEKSVRWAGARLIQNAYELTQNAIRPSVYAALLMQLAANLLTQPYQGASELLGVK